MSAQFKLTAKHLAFGDVQFIVEAENPKAAFTAFKNIVFNHKQWIVTDNQLIAGVSRNAGDPLLGKPGRHRDKCLCPECMDCDFSLNDMAKDD